MSFRPINHGFLALVQHSAQTPNVRGTQTFIQWYRLTNCVVEQEIRGLEALEYETARKLELLRESRDAAKFNSTWKGRTLNAVGYLFAIYCVVRVFNVSWRDAIYTFINICQSLANIVLPSRRLASSSTNYPDIISELLVYILSWVYTSRYIELEDVTPIARQLSLAFVGIMILTSIRLVLRGVTRVRNIPCS